ncbi:MAG: winged helix-turn-helix domain-containing protein [Lachnospiraceae bacterium]|nr:winged helix-turn-helix domain-containing protein [Lachnospiraceae bacterium]
MVIHFDVPKERRRELVTAMGEVMHVQPEYMRLPSKKYRVAYFLVSPDCQAEVDDGVDREVLMSVLDELAERGFWTATDDPAAGMQGHPQQESNSGSDCTPDVPLERIPAQLEETSDMQGRETRRYPVLRDKDGARITWREAVVRSLDGLGHPADVEEIMNYMKANVIQELPHVKTPENTICSMFYTYSEDSVYGRRKGKTPIFYPERRGVWGLLKWRSQ